MELGNRSRKALATVTLASAVFLLPLGAQAASAHDATTPAPAWGGGDHHDGRFDHGHMCWPGKDHRELRHRCDRGDHGDHGDHGHR